MRTIAGSFPYGRYTYQLSSIRQTDIVKIPKPNQEEGLTIGWPAQKADMDSLKALSAEIKVKM